METLNNVLSSLSSLVWGPPMLILLVGVGLFLTIQLRGLQIRALGHALKVLFSKDKDAKGDISHFSALMLSLGATVGTGNIVGVATAIALGGPGAIFWMWITGLVGMATKYSEAILAVKYREKGINGYKGGAMYYIKNGLNMPMLAMIFAILTFITSFGVGNMTQSNAVSAILLEQIQIPTWGTGIILVVLTGLVLMGGIKSIGKFTSYFSPVMVLIYVCTAMFIIITNFEKVPTAFELIFKYAFSPFAAAGGFAGAAVVAAIRMGVSRGLFSNEAGLGSSAIVAAAAKTSEPVKQALVSMLQTLIDTLFVCTMTAIIILMSPIWLEGGSAGILTIKSFEFFLGGTGAFVVFITTIFFAYSTLLGWSYFGEKGFEYAFGEKSVKFYRFLFLCFIMLGAIAELKLVWNFSDVANGLMAIPNLIALLLLYKVIKKETNIYFNKIS
ncbi:sodium:alanine symporter family protein [Malaciobacter mytili LMG 24559]|uniref:Sodium:alanine symporter family protein n=1 Tax=Malaciobacter mytili LMG 24559 TaxID=1032238 RepID=A0AAX2AIE9_9BACT|nr:sodium:alanine symporter family protein [Malaciobacter mytili]AXH14291.1 sodium:alanine symporter family protein [Malaciobacter mytili LMG 24559]RXK16514.1 sodium:alanine symporter family protein [Malaciobacter mytili LMG 24559]